MRLLIFLSALLLSACTDEESATKVLSEQGYTDVVTSGYSFLGCGRDDVYRTEFSAVSPTGKRVNGVVCGGWFKGSTVRFH